MNTRTMMAILILSTVILMGTDAMAGCCFLKTCKNVTVKYGHMLYAECKMDGSEQYKRSWLDLNFYIMNRKGKLVWDNEGNFMNSCSSCGWDPFKKDFWCQHCDSEQDPVINLQERICNANGKLAIGADCP